MANIKQAPSTAVVFFVMIPDISKHLMQPNNSMHLQSSSDEAHELKARFKNMKLCNN